MFVANVHNISMFTSVLDLQLGNREAIFHQILELPSFLGNMPRNFS